MLLKLKNVLSEIHLQLATGRVHGKVFEKISIVGFTKAKSLKDILGRAKHLDLSVPKKNIALSLGTWTWVPKMLCISFHAKHVQKNTQVVLKTSYLDLTITSQPIGISLKGIPSNKHHFTLTLRMTNMVWVIGKLPSLTKQRV